MHGDLDEAKLIEGLTGEKGIYKRRGDKEPEVCTLVTVSCSSAVCFCIISSIGSRPSDHYFCSVCLSFCLSVCLFVQSFSQPSLIRFRSN